MEKTKIPNHDLGRWGAVFSKCPNSVTSGILKICTPTLEHPPHMECATSSPLQFLEPLVLKKYIKRWICLVQNIKREIFFSMVNKHEA